MIDYAALAQRYHAGETMAALAAEAGITPQKLYHNLKKRGTQFRRARKGPSPPPQSCTLSLTTVPVTTSCEAPPFEREPAFASAGNLVTRYRPQTLAEVLGQPDVVAALRAFVASPYPAALLFHGESGCGKTSAAYALARDLGCAVEEKELGGLCEIPSGSQSADQVREILHLLRFCPLMGSGWRVLIVNECDRMSLPAETIWLDGLEHLPPKTVIVFTTNDLGRLSKRFRDRCEVYTFESATDKIGPWIQALARRVWQREVGQGECPALDSLGMPTLADADAMHASFRLALQQLQRHIRQAKDQGRVSDLQEAS
jgi:replication-associated recombination protein RarA